MAGDRDQSIERLEELQVASSLFGLSPEEQLEYDNLEADGISSTYKIADIISGIDLICSLGASMDLPERLRTKIASDAKYHLSQNEQERSSQIRPQASRQPILPWAIALAASLLLVASLARNWFPEKNVPAPSANELRAELLAKASDAVVVNWSQGTTPVSNASGDIVWSAAQQQGYMRFTNLPVNDPTKEQYQLWIFDRNQDAKTPVDGGVFDIANAAESVVAFHPKLVANRVYLFAVTIEKPGGVVVSDRSRLPLLANVP